jgi:hypothetical protein
MDLQIDVLRQLPKPILVLIPLRIAVYANQAALRLLGSPDPNPSPVQETNGRCLDELGIKLWYNRAWDVVLDGLVAEHTHVVDERHAPLPVGGKMLSRSMRLMLECRM